MSKIAEPLKAVRASSVPSSWSPNTLYYVTLGTLGQTDPTAADYPRVEVYVTSASGVPTAISNSAMVDARIDAYKQDRIFDSLSTTFFGRVTTAGGTLSDRHKIALNNMVLFLKRNAIGEGVTYLSKLAEFYPFCGNASGSIGLGLTDTSNGSLSGSYAFAGGFQGNGSNGYLNTGVVASAVSAGGFATSVDCLTNSEGDFSDLGVTSGSPGDETKQWVMRLRWSGGTFYGDGYTSAARIAVGSPKSNAVFTMSRLGSTLGVAIDGVYIGGATAGGSLPVSALTFGALSNQASGSPAILQHSPRKYRSLAVWKTGLTSAQMIAVNLQLSNYRKLMGE